MKKKYLLIIVILVLLISIPHFFRSIYKNNIKVAKLKKENAQLKQEYEKLQDQKQALLKDIKDADSNANIEKYARNKLNMSKQGERIYKVNDNKEKTDGKNK